MGIEEALLIAEALKEWDPEGEGEWDRRAGASQSFVLNLGLRSESVREFRDWSFDHAHLFATDEEALGQIAARFQELGARALAAGNLEEGRLSFRESALYRSLLTEESETQLKHILSLI